LDVAWSLAEQRGITSLSLRELAGEVGMAAPSLYTYFGSKAAIYDAMFAEGYRALDDLFASVRVDPGDTVGTLTDGTIAFLEFCRTSLPRYQLMFTRVIADWQPSPDAYAASIASYERMAANMASAGVVGQDALDLWTAITAGLAAQQLANDPTGNRWVRLTSDMAEMFVQHVRR
jgi:AcrR family transcriptional regulator